MNRSHSSSFPKLLVLRRQWLSLAHWRCFCQVIITPIGNHYLQGAGTGFSLLAGDPRPLSLLDGYVKGGSGARICIGELWGFERLSSWISVRCEKLAEGSAGAVVGFAGKPFAFSDPGSNLERRSLRFWTGGLGSETEGGDRGRSGEVSFSHLDSTLV